MKTNPTQNNIPSGWQETNLGEVGKVSMCKRILKSQTSALGDIPFFKIGTFGKKPDAFISKGVYNEYKQKYSFPKKGEILISASGTIGRTVVYDGVPAYFQDSNIIWIANEEKRVTNSFLLYVYEIVKWQTSSGTIARLYNDDIRGIKFYAPSLSEQSRIVAILKAWDQTIQKLSTKIEKKKNIKKGLMQELLTGKVRLPGFKARWESFSFGDIATSRKERFDPASDKTQRFCIELEHIESGSGRLLRNGHTADSLSLKTVFHQGDVLFGKLRAYLKKYWLATNDGVCSTEIWALQPNEQKIMPEILFEIVQSDRFIAVASQSQGTHMPRSNWEIVSEYEVDLPSIEEQKAIARVLTGARKEIELLERSLIIFKEQRKYLLESLIKGKIRTQAFSSKVEIETPLAAA